MFFPPNFFDDELGIQQLDDEVCTLRVTVQDLLSRSTELDHKRSNPSHELHLLHSMINDKRSRVTVQKLVEFQEQLKMDKFFCRSSPLSTAYYYFSFILEGLLAYADLERQESWLESKLLIREEEYSNLIRSGSINLDIYLTDSINKFNSLKRELATKMRANFSLRCQFNDVPVQAELIQYEKRFSELYAQIQEKHRLTRRYYATYNALLEIKELMLKEASLLNSLNLQKLEKAKQDLLAEQKVCSSLQEKHATVVAEERYFSSLLKTFQDACTEYERLRELAST